MKGLGATNNQNQEMNNWWSDLPFDLQNVKVSVGSRPIGFRYSPYIFNIEADLGNQSILTCGEDSNQQMAITKALAELVERSALISYPNKNNILTSNGWAAHENENSCRKSASLELIERDAVLAQWYSATPFIQLDITTLPDSFQNWIKKELSSSEFPNLFVMLSTEGYGPSISTFFINNDGKGVCGHSTKLSILESLESSISETCRAAHLSIRKSFWDDSISLLENKIVKVDPGTHAVYYSYHDRFPQWIFGKTVTWNQAIAMWNNKIQKIEFEDFSFKTVLNDPWVVGYATHPNLINVNWGSSVEAEIIHILRNRNIVFGREYKTVNLKPHIVS